MAVGNLNGSRKYSHPPLSKPVSPPLQILGSRRKTTGFFPTKNKASSHENLPKMLNCNVHDTITMMLHSKIEQRNVMAPFLTKLTGTFSKIPQGPIHYNGKTLIFAEKRFNKKSEKYINMYGRWHPLAKSSKIHQTISNMQPGTDKGQCE